MYLRNGSIDGKLTLIIRANFFPNGPDIRFALYLEKSNEASIGTRLDKTDKMTKNLIAVVGFG